MQEFGLFIIFWYGILHAFGPDHLIAITAFSVGKQKKDTLIITILFAFGHGIMLFIFAKLLQSFNINENILAFANIISSIVIILMGYNIIFMALTNKIYLHKHTHKNTQHIHIWFGKEHKHNGSISALSSFSVGALMGIGGVRGMFVILALIGSNQVNLNMILFFILGVMVVFIGFGFIISQINSQFLDNKRSVKRIYTAVGAISIIVGGGMLLS